MKHTDRKKIVVVYGNCHVTTITEVLSQCEQFMKEYEIYPIKRICEIKSDDYFNQPVFRYCDVFIHQSIQLHNRYGEKFASENIIKLLNDNCKVISIPNVYHLPMCFFPQYSPDKELVNRKKVTIFFRDNLIDNYFLSGLCVREIQEHYMSELAFSSDKIKEDYAVFLKKVKEREREWDIKVSDFIERYYRETQLFYDPNHPTPFFLKYIAKECLNLLEVSYNEKEIDALNVQHPDTFEMPICPSVRKSLGMKFTDKELRKTGNKIKYEKMYYEEYISQYVALMWQEKKLPVQYKIKSYCYYIGICSYNVSFGMFLRIYRKVYKNRKRTGRKRYEGCSDDSN